MSINSIIIIGSGPAAYTAALFTSNRRPLLFEGELIGEIGPGGQLTITTDVDNYPGFPKGTDGPELMESIKEQAKNEGVTIMSSTVVGISKKNDVFVIKDSYNQSYEARSVIIGTGASARRLYVPGTNEGEYWQKGISACAVCDGYAFRDKVVAVIGGGDSAMEEALYLSNIAKKVYVIHRRNEFRARNDKQDHVKNVENIEILTPYELVSAEGGEVLEKITLNNNETGKNLELEVGGLFFAIGHIPNVAFLDGLLELENGYIKTDRSTKTSVPGIFACGDVQDYYYRQAVTAAASGCTSGLECLKYLSELK